MVTYLDEYMREQRKFAFMCVVCVILFFMALMYSVSESNELEDTNQKSILHPRYVNEYYDIHKKDILDYNPPINIATQQACFDGCCNMFEIEYPSLPFSNETIMGKLYKCLLLCVESKSSIFEKIELGG